MGWMNMLGGLVTLAEGLKSSETPAFGQLASQLFGNSNPDQKAGLLNTLLATAGGNAP